MTDQPSTHERRKPTNRDVAALVLGAVVVALCLANRDKVKVDWIVTTWRTPLIVLIVGTLLVGMAIGYLLARRRARAKDD